MVNLCYIWGLETIVPSTRQEWWVAMWLSDCEGGLPSWTGFKTISWCQLLQASGKSVQNWQTTFTDGLVLPVYQRGRGRLTHIDGSAHLQIYDAFMHFINCIELCLMTVRCIPEKLGTFYQDYWTCNMFEWVSCYF